jgi:hypothetical protein
MEIREETGFHIRTSEITSFSQPAQQYSSAGEQNLRSAIYPSAGRSDEFIALYLGEKVGHFGRKFKVWKWLTKVKELNRQFIEDLQGGLSE